MLTPQQLDKKKFTVVHLRAGYDQAEVDNFLDRVQSDYELLYNSYQVQLQEPPVTQTLPVVPPTEPVSDMISKVLAVAEETAAQHITEARVQGEAMLVEARRDVAEIVENARAQAAAIVQEGQNERHKVIGELEDQRARLKDKVDELTRAETEVTTRMRTALERWNQ